MSGGPDHEYHGLTQLGRPTTLPANPRDAVLEKVAAPHQGLRYCVRFTAPEFTSLCPLTGQPDFAHLVIDYVPGEWIVESKSLKIYLGILSQPRRLPRGLHAGHRAAAGRAAGAAVAAHRRLLVSARRHPDRRVLAQWS